MEPRGPRISRRSVLASGAALLAGTPVWAELDALKAAAAPSLPAFDQAIQSFMSARSIPGGALAVVRNRQLVYTKGYGMADQAHRKAVSPTSLFRIASLSKSLTGVAVLKLVEQGKLTLEQPAFPILSFQPLPGASVDSRLGSITISQLLHHTGGWDRDQSFDPMFRSVEIAQAANTPPPASPVTIIRYMLGQPLDFDPGTRYAYSNFGFCVLGRIIEKLSGMTYAQFIANYVLAPAGIKKMKLGASLKSASGEVTYYQQDYGLANSVFPKGPRQVPWPYGGFCLEAMDSHGGWTASAVDMARFLAALDDPQHSPLLQPGSFEALYAPPPPPVFHNTDGSLQDAWYSSGWMVRPVAGTGKANYWHDGSLPGTSTFMARLSSGVSYVALFNHRTNNDGPIDPLLFNAASSVTQWPTINLFSKYP